MKFPKMIIIAFLWLRNINGNVESLIFLFVNLIKTFLKKNILELIRQTQNYSRRNQQNESYLQKRISHRM